MHIALISDVQDAFDPQKEYSSVTWEYYRCCLLRTLLSYNGQTTDQGGSELRPDLAAEMPVVSDDGLTWTFTLKHGITYAPPMQDVTVTSSDIVRALEREACGTCNVGGYSFYYSAIKGFDAFAAGDADSISGLETPDDSTLVVTLNDPTGDLGYRLAMPASAPIPPLPGEPKARLGAATGHDPNWGQFLVATGPYMFEGSEAMDFSAPPKEQTPVAGYAPGRSIVLVRNPSWDASTDDLRPAYADRIETTIGGTAEDIALKIDSGDIDIGLDAVPPANQVQQYSTDPDLEGPDPRRSLGRGQVLGDEPGEPAVRRHPRPQGAELGAGQAGIPAAPRRSDLRGDRGPHHGEQPGEQPARVRTTRTRRRMEPATPRRRRTRSRSRSTTRTRTACATRPRARTC